ncbi:MAG: hypothetical protein KDE19_24540 [Caldilineaceae bacterium]|nr:hypothetical protein [Caldilineaceae bacterium]
MTNYVNIQQPQRRGSVWQRTALVLLSTLVALVIVLAFFYRQSLSSAHAGHAPMMVDHAELSVQTTAAPAAGVDQQIVHAVRSTPPRAVALQSLAPQTSSQPAQWGQVPFAINEAPVANPGSPQTVVDVDGDGSQLVQLFGGGSYDPDEEGTIVSHVWSSDSGIVIPAIPNPVVDFPVGTHTITLTVTDGDDETSAKSISITVLAPEETQIYYRVNTGGGVTVPSDSSKVTWSGDNFQYKSLYLTTGENLRPYVTQLPVDISDASLKNKAITEGMMRSERYLETDGVAGQVMGWDFPLPENTAVEVRIYLAEVWFESVDERLFSIAIEGETPPQFNEINMFAQFGYHHAVVLTETLTVADGNLDIDFISIIENPAVKAIEIVEPGARFFYENFLYLPVVAR